MKLFSSIIGLNIPRLSVLALVSLLFACADTTPVAQNQSSNAATSSKVAPVKPQVEHLNNRPLAQVKKQPQNKGVDECVSLRQSACLSSKQCVLDSDKQKGYFCRKAADRCETDFIQSAFDAKSNCRAKARCFFRPASCFCPEGVQCICGGGKPAMCSSQKLSDSPLQ